MGQEEGALVAALTPGAVVLGGLPAWAQGAGPAPNPTPDPGCTAEWKGKMIEDRSVLLKDVNQFIAKNRSPDYDEAEFVSYGTFNISLNWGVALAGGASAAGFIELDEEIAWDLKREIGTRQGVIYHAKVRPWSTKKGRYGVWKDGGLVKTWYQYSNCNKASEVTTVGRAPYERGWEVWYKCIGCLKP